MERLRQAQVESYAEALRYIPRRYRDHLGFDMFCGDPVFAAIRHDWLGEQTGDGRSYRDIAHVCWPACMKDKRITMILPELVDPFTVIHELGHVLHANIEGRSGWRAFPRLQNVSRYAQTNYLECFAEAFALYVGYTPEYLDRLPDRGRTWWPWGWSASNAEFFRHLFRD